MFSRLVSVRPHINSDIESYDNLYSEVVPEGEKPLDMIKTTVKYVLAAFMKHCAITPESKAENRYFVLFILNSFDCFQIFINSE